MSGDFSKPVAQRAWMITMRLLFAAVIAISSLSLLSIPVPPVSADAGSTRVMCENDPSLVGCWRMEEGSGTLLQDGGALPFNDGTLINGPTWVAGKIGSSALSFDRALSQNVVVPHEVGLNLTQLTVAAWINPASPGATQDLVKKLTGNAGFEFSLSSPTAASAQKVFLRLNNTARIDSTMVYPIDGTWIHAAATYDGVNLRLYINGIENATPVAYAGPIAANTSDLTIGGIATRYYKGQMDDVRIYNRALSAAEITQLYTNTAPFNGDTTAPGAPTGLTPIPGDTTVDLTWTAPADPDVRGYNVFRSTTTPVDSSESATPINGGALVAVEAYSDSGLVNGTPYYYTVRAVDTSGNKSLPALEATATPVEGLTCYTLLINAGIHGSTPTADPANSTGCAAGKYLPNEIITLTALPDFGYMVSGWTGTDNDTSTEATNQVTMPATSHTVGVTYIPITAAACGIDPSLVGCWQMEEGSGLTLIDGSPNGNNAAVTGSPTWTPGVTGTALTLSGTGQYALAADSPSLDISNAITLSAWVKPGKLGTQNILKKTTGTATPNGYELSLSTPGKVFMRLNGNVNFRIDSVTDYPTDGQTWVHVATTYDGTTLKVYINGKLDNTKAAVLTIAANDTNLGIGAEPAATPINFFQGTVDDVRVYNRALALYEIQTLAGDPPPSVVPDLTCTMLDPKPATTGTGEKPQSKVWHYIDTWYAVFPTSASGASSAGTWLWRLEGTTWMEVLKLSASTTTKADVKVAGSVVHALLYNGSGTQLVSVEYADSTYQPWSLRAVPADITLSGSEIATIDIDSTGRMWLATEDDTANQIIAYYSDSPYAVWNGPLTIANEVSDDDISTVIAMPGKTGIFWSNQNSQRFGFRTHIDGEDPANWSIDEVPASQSALAVGLGMADDHLNVKVADDGTLYAAVKTSYDNAAYPKVALLIRHSNGSWDDLYNVDTTGTRGIIELDEDRGVLTYLYTLSEGYNPIVYRQSNKDLISFGNRITLQQQNFNDVSSMKQNHEGELLVIYSNASSVAGQICTPKIQSDVDLAVTKTDGMVGITPGGTLTYTITVSNLGPLDVIGASVTDIMPAALVEPAWTCSGSNGGSCTASGTGDISDLVNLPANASVTYAVSAVVDAAATGEIVNSAVVVPPEGLLDADLTNNAAADLTKIISGETACGSDLSLVGCWQMEENGGAQLIDGSGYSNGAALIGAPVWAEGIVDDYSLLLNGTSQYGSVADNQTLDLTTNITLSTWIQPEEYRTQDLVKKAQQDSVDGFELTLATTKPDGSTQRAFFRINQATYGDTYRINAVTPYPTDGTWMHVAATYDGATMKLFVNGVLESSLAATVPISTNDLPLTIGAQDGTTASRWFWGALDDARVYNRALEASEIQALYLMHNVADPGLKNLRASKDPAGVQLYWETSSEVSLAGFDVYRRVVDGTWAKINLVMVPANATGQAVGSIYTYLDTSAVAGVVYEYRLDAIEDATRMVFASIQTLYMPYTLYLPIILR